MVVWPFNVFGTANEDRSGCGGVLRDKEGVARALFSGSIAANDTDLVALEVFLAMKWKLNDSLFLELGSIVVFNWCANKSMRPWSLQATFAYIERDIEKDGNVVAFYGRKEWKRNDIFLGDCRYKS
ncbi:hypothetical protein Gohar_026003 [Gossypium harknessii]|uniref:RNase H type-1 domain-containing protein n=1 Tax=Gossypium harknessii TaxID=34285 RepID=A0A7J9HT09_9ROSI|nr:hypothetical protein [Gossypium harknessii]